MIPMRMNTVKCEYVRLDLSSTDRDEDYDEPGSGRTKHYSAAIPITAQIAWVKKEQRDRTATGDPGDSSGHLCLRMSTVTANSWVFNKGDRITEISGYAVDLEIIRVQPSGHLRGRANLLMLYFKERSDTNPALRG